MTISPPTPEKRDLKLPPLSSRHRRNVTFLAFLGILSMAHDLFLGLSAAEPRFGFMNLSEALETYIPTLLPDIREFFGETLYWGIIAPLFSLPLTPLFLILCLAAWVIALRKHIQHWTPLLTKPKPVVTNSQRAVWDERLENEVRKMREAKKDKES